MAARRKKDRDKKKDRDQKGDRVKKKDRDKKGGRLSRAAAAAASVSLATSGLSSCEDNGAVDPVPPPLRCDAIDMGQFLEASAQRDGLDVQIVLRSLTQGIWTTVEVRDAVGLTAVTTELDTELGPVRINAQLESDGVTQASLTFIGVLQDTFDDQVRCTVTRTLTLTIEEGGAVVVAQGAPLPLQTRDMPRLAIVGQEGRVVDVEAKTLLDRGAVAEWGATAGALEPLTPTSVRWTLPAEPGLYQIDVVLDYGADGVGFDAITVEVDGPIERA